MRRYRFDVIHELITRFGVIAKAEQEAIEWILMPDNHAPHFKTLYADIQTVLRSVEDGQP
jgi:hypothetical protein